jgi:hypothetical protein
MSMVMMAAPLAASGGGEKPNRPRTGNAMKVAFDTMKRQFSTP